MKKSQGFKRPYQVKKKKSILKSRFFWLFVLILIAGFAIFYLLIFSPVFQIKEIKIVNSHKVSITELQELVKNQVKHQWVLGFLSSKSIFLFKSNKVKEIILEQFPQIAEVNLVKEFPKTLEVTIKERVAVGIYCRAENCFFIDREGIIFEKSSQGSNLVIKSNIAGEEPALGNRVVDELRSSSPFAKARVIEKENLDIILEIKNKLKRILQIDIEEFIISEDKLTVRTSQGWEIYFDHKGDISWQLTELILVLEKQIPLQEREKLEYIDLRFSRVYYKYR